MHHVIPRHMGGSDDPSNLVELTIEEHAEAHYQLWLMCGQWEDDIAYRGLTRQINREEIHREVVRLANIGNKNAAGPHNGSTWIGKKLPQSMKDDISKTLKSKGIRPPVFTGHKQESKEAIRKSNIGTRYITDGSITRKIKPGMALPIGFEYGMAKRIA